MAPQPSRHRHRHRRSRAAGGARVVANSRDRTPHSVISFLQLSPPLLWDLTANKSSDIFFIVLLEILQCYGANFNTEIGIGLVGFGILFSFLGIIIFFDRGLLSLGNIFFLTGVNLLLGWQSMWQLFTKKANVKVKFLFLCEKKAVQSVEAEAFLTTRGRNYPSPEIAYCAMLIQKPAQAPGSSLVFISRRSDDVEASKNFDAESLESGLSQTSQPFIPIYHKL
ncbi:hypothetical protein ABZP36_031573 [Zizania latifolia]